MDGAEAYLRLPDGHRGRDLLRPGGLDHEEEHDDDRERNGAADGRALLGTMPL